MRPYILRKTYIRWFLLTLTVCTLVLPCLASAQSQVAEIAALEREGDYFEFQCSIMEVHPDHLVVCEKIIELVDFSQGGQRYKTMLLDHRGKSLTLRSFKKDDLVFIRGFKLDNGQILAREIYRLPRDLTNKQVPKFPFYRQIPKWEVQP